MSFEHVALERRGGVAVVRLDRAPANALEMELVRELAEAFDRAMEDAPEAMILTGTGPFFSGGLDLRVVPTYSASDQKDFLSALNRTIGKLYACPIPLVGAVNGHAIAGAFILALTCDHRVGPASGALFGLTEARAGIPFPAAPMIVLKAELAPSDVRYTTLVARNFGPEEARARGVLDELRPAAEVLDRAIEVARDLASMPADAYRRIKYQVRGAAIDEIERVAARAGDPMLESWLSPEALEASAAILDGPRAR